MDSTWFFTELYAIFYLLEGHITARTEKDQLRKNGDQQYDAARVSAATVIYQLATDIHYVLLISHKQKHQDWYLLNKLKWLTDCNKSYY